MDKKELRAQIRALKRQYTESQLAQKSSCLCGLISVLADYQAADTILLYHPLPDEVDVRPVIEQAFTSKKTVILPVVVGDDLELRVYSPDAMAVGAFGIMEPTGLLFADYGKITLAIIPGMAFDEYGHRLGRGKGYYDRLLPRLTKARKIGVCFDFQILDNVPAYQHDVLMDQVIAASSPS